ncbi:MAG: glycoside hydrolase [Gammaproteobacteria bacterium]
MVSIRTGGCLGALLLAVAAPNPARAQSNLGLITQDLQWRMVGPTRGGRTRAITGVPGQPHTLLVGAVNGGVWKTDDDGRTWTPIFDSQPTQSIGAIAVAPSDPRIIYVASGEGLHRPDLSVGNGMYRSSDAGRSWTHLSLEDAQQIPSIAVDPHDANRVYAAVLGHPYGPSAQRGLYRSLDGGTTWTKVLDRGENTGSSFVRIDPYDPQTLYAGFWNARSGPWEDKGMYNGPGGGLYKSTDGGEHWRALTDGLPPGVSQLDVAVAPSARGRLYATVATSSIPTAQGGAAPSVGVYRSDDAGEHWHRATEDARPAVRIGGGGDLPILKVDPTNADILYSASIVMMKSVDGGSHWVSFKGAPGGDDYQEMWISPEDPARIGLVGDQGALITVNGGRTWSSWYNQPTAQLYHIGITPTFPYRLCAGQQESGSVCVSSRGNDGEITFRDWHPVGVIEYGYVAPDPIDSDIIYGAGRNVVTKTHLSTGQVQDISPIPVLSADDRTDRTEPILFSPQDLHRLYYAANRLYATSDGGASWQPISGDLARPSSGSPPSVGDMHADKAETQRGVIYSVSASPVMKGMLWAGTDDGLVWVTSNEGRDWVNVTPPALTPWSKVTQIEASHFDAKTAYVSVSRFRLDDMTPYVYRTRDGGQTWQLITSGLASDAPVNAVREDTAQRQLLFAATERSVWVSLDDGEHWQSLQLNLPHTSMRDLAIHDQDLIVATHGRSFWVLDDIGPLRDAAGAAAHKEAVLLKPSPAVRVMRSTGTDTPIPPDEPTARNPPDGAVIDYYLPHAVKGEVAIEVLDSRGILVRRATSTDPLGFSEQESAHERIPMYWIRQPKPLATTAGMHRFVWDMHYTAPRSVKREFPISAVPFDTPQVPQGPAAIPGAYRVRLKIDTHQSEQPLMVTADPRVGISQQDYLAQLDLAQSLAGALDASSAKLLQVKALRDQLKSLVTAEAAIAARAKALDTQFQSLMDPASGTQDDTTHRGLERINDEIHQLYEQVVAADAAPSRSQQSAADSLFKDWRSLAASSTQIWQGDLAGLNQALAKSRLPILRDDAVVPEDAASNNEE